MDAVLCETAREIKLQRDHAVFTAVKDARHLERELLVSPQHRNVNAAFRRICYMLHELAQKYVPNNPTTFEDYERLTHCTKLLQAMGLKPQLNAQLDAATAATGVEVIFNSFEYRHLRNKIMASLSIIADLTDRPAGTGSPDYQRGMREGYRRASDIAVAFLTDISGDV